MWRPDADRIATMIVVTMTAAHENAYFSVAFLQFFGWRCTCEFGIEVA
jgi:hypothetical protein